MKSLVSKLAAGLRSRAAEEPFGVRGTVAYTIDELARGKRRAATPAHVDGGTEAAGLARRLREVGFAAIPNFISADEASSLREKLHAAIEANPAYIHPSTPYDLRLHGVENVEPSFKWFAEHPMLNEVAQLYMATPTSVAFTLGASLQSVPGNPGSGGGWHRDSFGRQFKTMLYLTDVGPDNGPFQIIEASHRFGKTIDDNVKMAQPYGNSRLTHEQVMGLLDKTGHERLHTLGGEAGTLLFFDSSSIHRGSPIKTGLRMALTNYFYPNVDIDADLYAHFRPVAGH